MYKRLYKYQNAFSRCYLACFDPWIYSFTGRFIVCYCLIPIASLLNKVTKYFLCNSQFQDEFELISDDVQYIRHFDYCGSPRLTNSCLKVCFQRKHVLIHNTLELR